MPIKLRHRLGAALLAIPSLIALTACSGGQLTDEWLVESSTSQYMCGIVLGGDGTFSQNCNGQNPLRGTWKLDGSSIRFQHEQGFTSVCSTAFDGSILVLSGSTCRFPNRYQRSKDWYKEH